MIGTSSRPEEMRDALRCGMPGCKCAQPRGNVHCPSHPDEHPSLSISERDGTTLVHCHAGCTQDAVFAALRERGLWPSRADASRWELRTADGGHVATHVRTDRPDGAKSVRWEQPDGRPGLGGVSTSALPVYGAERLNGATEVVVAEGEPAADALLEKDIAAVATVTGASGTPSDDSLQLLLGRTVYLWPDADTAGIEHMDRLGERLRALGCEDVRVVRGVDAADVVGGDVRRLLSKARPWQPPKPNLLLKGSPCEVRLPEVDLADVKPSDGQGPLPSLPLLDQSAYVIEGWSHLVAALPKAGKTELIYASVLEWARAGMSVLWFSEESESVWAVRRGRVADMPRGVRLVYALGSEPTALLERATRGGEQVVVVDTVRSLLGLADEIDNSEIARKLGAWEAALRGRTRLYLHHLRKGMGEHGLAVAGGTMLVGAVDRLLELRHDEHDAHRRRLRVTSRLLDAPDLLIGLQDGWPVALGDPAAVELQAATEAVCEALEPDVWLRTAEVRERLNEPRPSASQVRRALDTLRAQGAVEREPGSDRPGATYRWRAAQPNLARHLLKGEVRLDDADADKELVAHYGGTDDADDHI